MYYRKFPAESISEGGERAWASARAGWPEARRAARAVEVRLISYTPRSSICRSVQMRITIFSAFPACPPAQCPCTFLWVHLGYILCGTHLDDRLRFADAGLRLKYIDMCDLGIWLQILTTQQPKEAISQKQHQRFPGCASRVWRWRRLQACTRQVSHECNSQAIRRASHPALTGRRGSPGAGARLHVRAARARSAAR